MPRAVVTVDTITCPPASPHVIPDRFRRWVNTVLHAASVTPLPIGTACATSAA